jgi:hypothetical protein
MDSGDGTLESSAQLIFTDRCKPRIRGRGDDDVMMVR